MSTETVSIRCYLKDSYFRRNYHQREPAQTILLLFWQVLGITWEYIYILLMFQISSRI
ncbi:unnamed protein product [Blumeria hordei]|uniref:Uncharacterized protein n=1 Tax=Blumeria hordei TaxID=2867405 RepID=A0A383UJ56_BLUHO|nr:unnamed protein product [Blumeria hordei]